MGGDIFITERLILRQFNKCDSDALFSILSDEEVNTYLPMFPLKTKEEAQKYLQEHFLQNKNIKHYAICLKEDNIPIGYIQIDKQECHDFGYALKKEYWHKGFMIEACEKVIQQLKQEGFPYITATHDRMNLRSGNVMKKLGMTYCYSYEEQWQPKDILVTFRMYQLHFDNHQKRIYKGYWNKYANHFIETDL